MDIVSLVYQLVDEATETLVVREGYKEKARRKTITDEKFCPVVGRARCGFYGIT